MSLILGYFTLKIVELYFNPSHHGYLPPLTLNAYIGAYSVHKNTLKWWKIQQAVHYEVGSLVVINNYM